MSEYFSETTSPLESLQNRTSFESLYDGNIEKNKLWTHGTKKSALQFIHNEGIKNGKENLAFTLARNVGTSLAEWFGGGDNGVLLVSRINNDLLFDVSNKRKPLESYSLKGKVEVDNITLYIPGKILENAIKDLIIDIRIKYSSKEDFAFAHIRKLAAMLLLNATAVDGTSISSEEALQTACELVWNEIEITLRQDLDLMITNFSILLAEPSKYNEQLNIHNLSLLIENLGESILDWDIETTDFEKFIPGSSGQATKVWFVAKRLIEVAKLWHQMEDVTLVYDALNQSYKKEIDEMKTLGSKIFSLVESVKGS